MMDVTVLAKDVVVALAPALPYLVPLGKTAVDEIGKQGAKKLAEAVWERAQGLWDKLQPKVSVRPAAEQAAQYVAANPEDPDGHASLRLQLKILLAEEPVLAEQLVQLLKQSGQSGAPSSATATGERSVAVGHNAYGSITTGDQTESNTPPRQ